MAGKLLLEVVTPDHLLLSQQVDEVIAPGTEGEFGVLPGHAHFLSTLTIGDLRYRVGEVTSHMSVLWGFAQVTPTRVTILAEIAERAEAAVAKAQRRLEVGGLPSELKEAQISLEKARLRKKLAERARRSSSG